VKGNRILGCEGVIEMGKLLLLCGAFLCLSFPAAAQDSPAAVNNGSNLSDQGPAGSSIPMDREHWQVGAGFQYQHFSILGVSFHNLGFNSEITRYLNNWLGVEAAAAEGFGHTGTSPSIPVSLNAKSFFIGGGPHIAVSNSSRVEPWAHVLVGQEHFRFTQTNSKVGLGGNSGLGLMVGGGVDYKLGRGANWRVQGDYVGSRISGSFQSNYSVGTGIVINF
jgi:hypothetical protein